MRVSLIAAMGRNHVIGDGAAMPWHLPRDLRRFRRVTMGKPIIMGRKTFASIGRPLPGRPNIVLTRSGWRADGVTAVPDAEAALTAARAHAGEGGEAMVVGGGEVYRLFLPLADRVYLTVVDASPEGSATFPFEEMFRSPWRVVEEESTPADAANPYADRYLVLDAAADVGVDPATLLV